MEMSPRLWLWLVLHPLNWALLYAAFGAQSNGAMNLLKFLVWTLFSLVALSLFGKGCQPDLSNPNRQPLLCRRLNLLQFLALGGLLAWFGHFATATAWGFVLLHMLAYAEKTEKLRAAKAAASGGGVPG